MNKYDAKNNIQSNLDAFNEELNDLLKKHHATLGVAVDGDTHGIWNERIEVNFVLPREDERPYISDDYMVIGDNINTN